MNTFFGLLIGLVGFIFIGLLIQLPVVTSLVENMRQLAQPFG